MRCMFFAFQFSGHESVEDMQSFWWALQHHFGIGGLRVAQTAQVVQLHLCCAPSMDAMDQLDEWMELDRPRGWSMQHGHRRRLMPAEGDDFVRCRGRSTVKRTLASGKRWQPLEKNKSHKCHGGNQLVTTGDEMGWYVPGGSEWGQLSISFSAFAQLFEYRIMYN